MKSDPVRPQIFFTVEDPEKRSLMYIPAANWTRENGFMLGVAVHNGFILPKRLEYLVMPFYAFGNNDLAGFGRVSYNIMPFEKFIRKATISLEGTQYGAPGNQNYQKIKTGVDLYFRNQKNEFVANPKSLRKLHNSFQPLSNSIWTKSRNELVFTIWIPLRNRSG